MGYGFGLFRASLHENIGGSGLTCHKVTEQSRAEWSGTWTDSTTPLVLLHLKTQTQSYSTLNPLFINDEGGRLWAQVFPCFHRHCWTIYSYNLLYIQWNYIIIGSCISSTVWKWAGIFHDSSSGGQRLSSFYSATSVCLRAGMILQVQPGHLTLCV